MLLLTLKAGPNRYAIDATRIIELVPRVELRPIPHAPLFLAGLLGYRGKVVPVIDLGSLFDSAPCPDCLSTRIILVNDAPGNHNRGSEALEYSSEQNVRKGSDPTHDPSLLGLIGEQVSDLLYIRPEQVVATPVQLSQTPFLDAIVQTEDGILQLIAVERIRETSLRGLIPDQETLPDPSPSNGGARSSELEDLKTTH